MNRFHSTNIITQNNISALFQLMKTFKEINGFILLNALNIKSKTVQSASETSTK